MVFSQPLFLSPALSFLTSVCVVSDKRYDVLGFHTRTHHIPQSDKEEKEYLTVLGQ